MASKRKSVSCGYYRGAKILSREDELQEAIKLAAKNKESKRKARINNYLNTKIKKDPSVASLIQEYELVLSDIKNLTKKNKKKYEKIVKDQSNFYILNFNDLVAIQKEITPQEFVYDWSYLKKINEKVKRYYTDSLYEINNELKKRT